MKENDNKLKAWKSLAAEVKIVWYNSKVVSRTRKDMETKNRNQFSYIQVELESLFLFQLVNDN